MSLQTLMQAGPTKANALFMKLSETSAGALKTREKLFAELRAELGRHADLKEQHLFPVLKTHADTKEFVAAGLKDNKELRAKLAELEALPKNHEMFLAKVAELRKTFRRHARNEAKELLPAIQKTFGEEQVQGITEKIETSLAEVELAKHDKPENKRAAARQEREQAERQAQQDAAAKREQQEAERRAQAAAHQSAKAMAHTAKVANERAHEATQSVTETAQHVASGVPGAANNAADATAGSEHVVVDTARGAPSQAQETVQLGLQMPADAQAQWADIRHDQGRRSAEMSAPIPKVYRNAAQDMQALLGYYTRLGHDLQQYQHAYLDLLTRSMESMARKQQDLFRCNSPVQFAELQRDIYFDSVNTLFTCSATLLRLKGQ